jgi:hypothetical protein
MTSPSRELAERANRYQSLSNFYLADRRRRSSRERDVGLWWRVGAHGPIYRAAWVRDTGELYVTRLGPLEDGGGEVVVLGRARDRGQLEDVLQGWQDACPQPDSMTWLVHRAASLTPPEKPERSLALAPDSQAPRGDVSRLTRPRRPGARSGSPGDRPDRGSRRSNAAVPSRSTVAAREASR